MMCVAASSQPTSPEADCGVRRLRVDLSHCGVIAGISAGLLPPRKLIHSIRFPTFAMAQRSALFAPRRAGLLRLKRGITTVILGS